MEGGQELFGAGRSSFQLVDSSRVIRALSLTPSSVFLDLGCGRGDYTLAAAEIIGPGGRAYGVDGWQDGLDELERRASARGLDNVSTIRANLNEHLPLGNGSVDACLLATVLHDLLREGSGEVALDEIARVLKPRGRLAIVEFRKIENGPGPPFRARLAPEETEAVVAPFGFVREGVVEVGPFNYLFTAVLSGR